MCIDTLNNYEISDKFKDSVFTQEFFKIGKYITLKLKDEFDGEETKPIEPLLPFIDGVDGNSVYLAYGRNAHGVCPAMYLTKRLVYGHRVKKMGGNNKAAAMCLSFIDEYMQTNGVLFNEVEYNAMVHLINWFKTKPRVYVITQPQFKGDTISTGIYANDTYFHLVISLDRFKRRV